ncbi:MAG: OmpA family protein [Blastochloris sp.]|nr:OmpA family protein [Blastochloris sp.]
MPPNAPNSTPSPNGCLPIPPPESSWPATLIPGGTTQYNVGLGERRALATRDYLLGLGADGSRLITVSYGEERPADPSENESAWSKNRRCAAGVLP